MTKTAVTLFIWFAGFGAGASPTGASPMGPVPDAPVSEATAPAQGPAGPTCVVPHGAGPGYNASIGNQMNGRTVCIRVGEKLLVLLNAGNNNASPWRHIRVSKPGILRIAPLTLMLSRGLTGTNFQAVRPGTVRLTSERTPCGLRPAGVMTCDVIELWQATVVVRPSVP